MAKSSGSLSFLDFVEGFFARNTSSFFRDLEFFLRMLDYFLPKNGKVQIY